MFKGVSAVAMALVLMGANIGNATEATAKTGTWDGLYLGGFVGINGSEYDADHDSDIADDNQVLDDYEAKGLVYGGTLGYNLQMDSFIYGIEGDLTFGSAKTEMTASDGGSTFDSDWPLEVEADYLATLRLRVGYEVVPALMVFGTGGIAYRSTEMAIPDEELTETFDAVGYAVGAGAEYKYSDTISLKAEYVMHGFDKTYDISNVPDGNKGDFLTINDVHVGRIGLNFHF